MRTYIYVDSFNLYYGALRSTPYKWLNLASLFRSILRPHHRILKIKYFTALVDERPDDPKKPERQNVYLRALETYCPEIEIYYGKFLNHRVSLTMANNPNNKVEVIKTEEKGSDVNLAVNLLNDAILDKYE